MADAPEGFVRLNIGLPLPLDVVVTMSNLLSKTWPNSKIDGNYSAFGPSVMSVLIPEKEASRPKKLSAKAIEEAREPITEDTDGIDVTGLEVGDDSISLLTVTNQQKLSNALLILAQGTLAEYPDAKNYLEWTIRDPDAPEKQYVITVRNPDGQTPHQLRQKAEQERDVLAQAMWDARRELGFDNDGDPTPAASVTGDRYEEFAHRHVEEAKEQRRDHDEALATPTAEQVYQAWHGTDGPWAGCADKESIARVLALIEGR